MPLIVGIVLVLVLVLVLEATVLETSLFSSIAAVFFFNAQSLSGLFTNRRRHGACNPVYNGCNHGVVNLRHQ